MTPSPQWLALYTKSRQERVVMKYLLEDGIEAFVPLHKVLRQWSDRKKLVEEPLIRSYCFVHALPTQQHQVLSTPGAVRFVWFGGRPATIPARQIDFLKILTGHNIPVENIPGFIKPGTMVRITAGPMAGFTGELVSVLGKSRVIVRLTELETAISLTISPAMLERS
jgi:transcriptional antiterminator RfaH